MRVKMLLRTGPVRSVMLAGLLGCMLGCPAAPDGEPASKKIGNASGEVAGGAGDAGEARGTGRAEDQNPGDDSGTVPTAVTTKSGATQETNTADSPAALTAGDPPPGAFNADILFKDWPMPDFALVITGRQDGYIEPCGCTGLANQRGGLSRRHSLIKQLREQGWTVPPLNQPWAVVPIDGGNQIRRTGRQPEIKFQITVDSLRKMQYRAVAFGPDDLHLPALELFAVTGQSGAQTSPFVCANAAVLDAEFTPPYQIVEVADRKVGITAVFGDRYHEHLNNSDILVKPAEQGLAEVMPQLREQQCDLLVLLAHAPLDQSRALAQKFADFDVVVCAGGTGDPSYQPESVPDGKAMLVQCGIKGMYAGVIGVFDDPQKPLRYQRVPLDSRFADSREMLDMLAYYQEQLEREGLEQLGVVPVPHPSGRTFVGSETCRDCHDTAYDIWKNGVDGEGGKPGPHAIATDTLVHPGERSEIARHHDPECLSCHVTGWNPQKFYPYASGYLSLEATPHLVGNGCENCHGPGSAHVAAENGEIDATVEMLRQLQQEMRVSYEQAEQRCMECHDLDNSPDFHEEGAFEKVYWPQIKHGGG